MGTASPEGLKDFAAERLAPPRRPKDYYRVDALPHTATGKVKRLGYPASSVWAELPNVRR